MTDLILHPTDTCQWYALVTEAQARSCLVLDEDSESYLVFLLMRFTQQTQIIESIIALDFLESMQEYGRIRANRLSDVGDKSLLMCGLFPGLAVKRRVQLDYYSGMGQAAYLTASEFHGKQLSELYAQLGAEFKSLQRVLQTMRGDCLQLAGVDSSTILNVDMPVQ